MSVRAILRYPDPGLRRPADPVILFDAELHALAGDLLDTMRAAPGIGITAPHIGVARRLVVIDLTGGEPRHYANPAVVWASAETILHEEGSVSMPGAVERVERAARVRVDYQDLDGSARSIEAEGLLAVCLQHEIDQLDGIFWLRRLSPLRRDRLVKRYDKAARRSGGVER